MSHEARWLRWKPPPWFGTRTPRVSDRGRRRSSPRSAPTCRGSTPANSSSNNSSLFSTKSKLKARRRIVSHTVAFYCLYHPLCGSDDKKFVLVCVGCVSFLSRETSSLSVDVISGCMQSYFWQRHQLSNRANYNKSEIRQITAFWSLIFTHYCNLLFCIDMLHWFQGYTDLSTAETNRIHSLSKNGVDLLIC